MDEKRLSRQHWKALDVALSNCPMELEEFQKLYPGLTRQQLARVAGCSIDVADRWYGKSRRIPPTDHHKLRFAIAHWVWSGKPPQAVSDEMAKLKDEFKL